jgi:hypothetical protein
MNKIEIEKIISEIVKPTADQRCLITEIRAAIRRGSIDTATKLAGML